MAPQTQSSQASRKYWEAGSVQGAQACPDKHPRATAAAGNTQPVLCLDLLAAAVQLAK